MRTRPDCHAPIKDKEAAFPEVCPLLFHVVLDALLQSVQVVEALQSTACSQSSYSAHGHPKRSCSSTTSLDNAFRIACLAHAAMPACQREIQLEPGRHLLPQVR